jgi:hypothetical protein
MELAEHATMVMIFLDPIGKALVSRSGSSLLPFPQLAWPGVISWRDLRQPATVLRTAHFSA